MRRSTLFTALLTASVTTLAHAQPGATKAAPAMQIPPGIAGTWLGKTMTGPKDSVITTTTTVVTADGKGWTAKLGDRAPMPVRVLAAGGDSVVTEMGPYSSILRPGIMATTRQTLHFKGDNSWGTFEAKYANGDVVKGKSSGARKK